MRYRACEDLLIKTVPCIVYENKEAYTFNRMVNRLSGYQEIRMLRKSLETLDERTIADVFGMRSIRYRLAPTLVRQLHPKVAEAFEADILGKTAALEMSCALPERQLEMLKEMKRVHDYSPVFVRALILKTPPEQRNPKRSPRQSWSDDKNKRRELVTRLKEADRQQGFYTKLYRQYTADLLKMILYIRQVITTPELNAYLAAHHQATLNELTQIVLETPAVPDPA